MRVQPFTQDDLDAAADRLEALTLRGLHEVAGVTSRGLTAAIVPVSLDDLAELTSRWAKLVLEVILPELVDIFTHGAQVIRGRVFAGGEDVGIASPSQIFQNPAVTDFMSRAENRLKGVGNDLWEHARSEVTLGLQQGESIDQIASRITTAADLTEPRARTVARTEAIAASNAGGLLELRSYDLEAVKEWLATNDEHTRPTHREADGQSTDITGRFQVGQASLDFPGDPTGPPGEVINCRCTLVYEIADDEVESLTAAMPPALERYWIAGEGGLKIRWNTPGDFTRCVRQLREHVRDPQGTCANLHKKATGKWPGEDRG